MVGCAHAHILKSPLAEAIRVQSQAGAARVVQLLKYDTRSSRRALTQFTVHYWVIDFLSCRRPPFFYDLVHAHFVRRE